MWNLQRWSFLNLDVGFCFYEDSIDTIKRAIESVKDHVRYIFAIDGKFEFLDSEQTLSTPDIREYLSTVPNVILVDAPNLKENFKRQIYIDMSKEYNTDVLIIMDSDEWVTERTSWDKVNIYLAALAQTKDKPLIRSIPTQNPGCAGNFPKVWINPHMINYTETHNFWRFPDNTIWKSTNNYPPVDGLYMRQNDKLRTKSMLDKTFTYQGELIKYEKPFKKKYRHYAKG